jgi:hypothetical protein
MYIPDFDMALHCSAGHTQIWGDPANNPSMIEPENRHLSLPVLRGSIQTMDFPSLRNPEVYLQ